MGDVQENILSKILKKRVEALGYASLKKFYSDRKELGCSYELLRQVVHAGRVPRSESLLRILHAMRFGPPQVRKIMELHYDGYVPQAGIAESRPADSGEENPHETRETAGSVPSDPTFPAIAGEGERQSAALSLHDPGEITSRLSRSLPKIPLQGNEDCWEIILQMAGIADRKVQELARRKEDQPLLFEKEPEVIYHFLVRRSKIPPFLSKGENLPLEFTPGIDYRDRFRGALLGAAIGETLGRPAQGLSPRDIRELYGRIEGYAPLRSRNREPGAGNPSPPASLLLARSLLRQGRVDPEEIAVHFASAPGRSRGIGEAEFAANLAERGYPWFESGVNIAESAPASWVVPLALLRAADFRRLKLEAGIVASVTHPSAASIAGSIVQAAAVARLLHTPTGSLDVLGFARGVAPAITGIEPDRATRSRQSRQSPTLLRKLGTELAALLLRRAEIEEMQESLGNGPAVQEGLPFAWAGFLRSPERFDEAVLPAVNLGNDAEGVASMAGSLCGAYIGASAIPERFLVNLPWRKELERAADGLLSLARRDPEKGGTASPSAS
ncbi:MAG TPA: ADP-ribosylglycohydrolase family protein [Candidatus Limnocylindrales bacterium]|nr:ADP-ribosylglycohydrolase family protein [Candidatus Limnocylindrales bacterium]